MYRGGHDKYYKIIIIMFPLSAANIVVHILYSAVVIATFKQKNGLQESWAYS